MSEAEDTQVVTKEKVVQYWLERTNQNPGTASYLLAQDMLTRAEKGEEPSSSTIAAFNKLKSQAAAAISGTLTHKLTNCLQTGGLHFASDRLWRWTQLSEEERKKRPLQHEKIELDSLVQGRYQRMADEPLWVG